MTGMTVMSSGRLNPKHRHDTSGQFAGKGPHMFHDFPGGGREEARGSPRRPKEGQGTPKGAKRTPRGARKEVQGAKKMPKGRQMGDSKEGKRSKQRQTLYTIYKLTPDQPQSGWYVNQKKHR